ncbi:MAG TPA: reverse transcriptase domain-containing protein [Planctomycetota bacterium]|jgi:retron-type reverse transcriptase
MGLFDWLLEVVFGNPQSPPRPVVRPQTPSRPNQGPAIRPGARPVSPSQRPVIVVTPAKPTDSGDSPFAPITRGDVKKEMGKLGRPTWSNPWFGRRDLIPPASDKRTMVIDRAMVTDGFITPEDLVEIHKVGEEMEKVRPDLVRAEHEAGLAVERAKQDRDELKKQKKAEAAERKRKRAEQIAERKATDIIFLGRGVSHGLADRRANVEKLQQAGLPVLAHPQDLAQAFGISIKRLRWLAFHSEAASVTHYVCFQVPKRNGKVRTLSAPHKDLAHCQEWILRNILDRTKMHPAAHGFIVKHSTLTNAVPHVAQDVVVNSDLKDFFPTITFPRVRGIFQGLGYSPAAATILALLCTEAPRRKVEFDGKTYHVATGPRALPQGACTSPALSNLIASRMDARLSAIAAKLGWNYSRYADDLTLSAKGEPAAKTGYVLARIRHIAQDEGFAVNEEKTRVQRRNVAQSVTGIVVNQRPGVPRKLARRIRAILHRAKREGLAAQNREERPNFDAWLSGTISYIAMVNPPQGKALRTIYESLRV